MNVSNNEKNLVQSLLQENFRLDGRTPLSNRVIKVQFFKSPGHLLYQQGETSIIIKSFLQLSAPKQQRPSEGFILFKVDCTCCNDTFDQNKKLAIQLAKLLQKNIIGSNALDPQSLCIITGKYVWKLSIQCKVINDDGNVIDSVLNGVITALTDMKKPLINVDKNNIQIKQSKLQPLSIAHLPISLTFFFVDNNIFTDATYLQELCSLTRLTITMNIYKQVCSIHKPGGMGLDQTTISGTVKIMEDKIKQLTQDVRITTKTRNQSW